MSILSIDRVKKEFGAGEEQVTALKEISFKVEQGEFIALAGASGSGKTTLLNLIGGLDRPSSGRILINGSDITDLSDNDLSDFRRKNLGFVFQSFNLLPVLTALENVEYPLLRRSSGKDRRQKAQEILTKVGLGEKLDRYPHELSGGQKQRVALARALVHQPSMVLADEPTANLDKKTGAEVIEIMKDLNNRFNVTFVFSTHDPEMMSHASRTLYISDGRVLKDSKTASDVRTA